VAVNHNLVEEIHRLHAHICSGLADPTRIMILYALAELPLSVTQIAETLDMPQPSISRHLKHLRDCGLLQFDRDGQTLYYRLKDPRVLEALNILRAIMTDFLEERAHLINEALYTNILTFQEKSQ
jgi:ArsR family transcriptional regulator